MTSQDPSQQSPTKSTDLSTMESSNPSPSTKESLPLPSRLLQSEEALLIQSIQDVITSYGSSIHLLLRIDRKDADVYCSIFINHKRAGNLRIQIDEYLTLEERLMMIGFEIEDLSTSIKEVYLDLERSGKHVRKLYKPRDTYRPNR